MGILLKVLAYGAVGMILLFLNFVFIARIRAEFREDIPADPIIGPFRIIGRQADDKTGEVMAELLVARVDSLGDEITTTFHSLTKLLPKTGVGAARSRRSSINEPEEQPVTNQMRLNVLEPPADVRLSVAGVEVGGFIPWLQRYAVADRMLHVSVNYQKDKIIAAATTSSSRRSIWLELPSDESELKTPNADAIENAPLDVVTELAYALQKQKFEVIYPSLRPLDLHQFRNLLALLRKAAQLNQRTAAQQATESDYEAILAEIDKFLVHPEIAQWPSFLELAGQVAERAGRFGRATAFLTSAKNFAETKQEKALLDQRISEVLGAKQAHLAEGNEELLRTVRTLGLDKSIAVKRRPRVAVLGMPPPMPAAVSYPVIGQYSVPKNSAIATHTLRVLDVVKRLAPNADLAIVSLDLPAVDNGAFSSE
ncbi:MAG: hypothetical protein QOE68_342, partial [Thermoanaerobaculia bacterium]|nr:hypothetical protein [Thermoanaerobaculia bacterium]